MKPRAALVGGALLLAAIYGRTLRLPFLSDDTAIPVSHDGARGLAFLRDPFLGIGAGNEGESRYRPLAALSWEADHAMFGTRPEGYRLHGFLIHALSAVALAALGSRLARGFGATLPRANGVGCVAGLLFLAHPAQHDAVVWIVARGDLLATFFTLLALLLFARARQSGRPGGIAPALGCALCAHFSKETTFTLPGLVALAELALPRRGAATRRLSRALGFSALFLAPLLLFAFARREVAGALAPGATIAALRAQPFGVLVEGTARALIARVRALFVPAQEGEPLLAILLGLATLAALAPALARPRARILRPGLLAACALALSLLPSLYIRLEAGNHLNARILHLPVAFVGLALASAAATGGLAGARAAALLVAAAVTAHLHSGVWVRAGESMREIERAIRSVADPPPGSGLVLVVDPPEYTGGVPTFWNAGKFLLQPPLGRGGIAYPVTREEVLAATLFPEWPRWRAEGLAAVWRNPAETDRLRAVRLPAARGNDAPVGWRPARRDANEWILEPSAPISGARACRLVVDASEAADPSVRFVLEAIPERDDTGPIRVAGASADRIAGARRLVFALDESFEWSIAGRVVRFALTAGPRGSIPAAIDGVALEPEWPRVEIVAPEPERTLGPGAPPPPFLLAPTRRGDQLEILFFAHPRVSVRRVRVPWDGDAVEVEFRPDAADWNALAPALAAGDSLGWRVSELRAGLPVARSEIRWIRPAR